MGGGVLLLLLHMMAAGPPLVEGDRGVDGPPNDMLMLSGVVVSGHRWYGTGDIRLRALPVGLVHGCTSSMVGGLALCRLEARSRFGGKSFAKKLAEPPARAKREISASDIFGHHLLIAHLFHLTPSSAHQPPLLVRVAAREYRQSKLSHTTSPYLFATFDIMTVRLVGKPPSPLPSMPRRSQSLRYAALSAETQRAFRRTQSMPTTPIRKWRARRRELSGSFAAAVASNAASGTIYSSSGAGTPAAGPHRSDRDAGSAAGGLMRRWTATPFFLVVAAQLFVKGMVGFSVSSQSDGGIMDGISPTRRLATAEQQPSPQMEMKTTASTQQSTDGPRIATQTDVLIKPYGKAARALRGSSSLGLHAALAGADSTSKRRGRGAKSSSSPPPPPTMGPSLLVGIVRNATSIAPENMALLAELACKHNTESHILAAHGADDALEAMRLLMTEDHPARSGQQCADVAFVQEPSDIVEGANERVDRIALLRDYQRNLLARRRGTIPSADGDADQSPPAESGTDMAEGVVIVTDLDLTSLPPADDIMEEANAMVHDGREDIVCAAGVMHHPFGYYDIFA